MRNFFLMAFLLLATACTSVLGTTPGQVYYGLKQDFKLLLVAANDYAEWCAPRPATSVCHNVVDGASLAAEDVAAAFKEGDKYIVDQTEPGNVTKLQATIDKVKMGLDRLKFWVNQKKE